MSNKFNNKSKQIKINKLETGILSTREDWAGVFIRGVDCFEYSNAIKVILSETTCENTLIIGQLKELMDLFRSVDQESPHFESLKLQIVSKL